MYEHRYVVISALDQAKADALMEEMLGPSGRGTFAQPLSVTGLPPWTHYWTGLAMLPEHWEKWEARCAEEGIEYTSDRSWVNDNPRTPEDSRSKQGDEVLTAQRLKQQQADPTELLGRPKDA